MGKAFAMQPWKSRVQIRSLHVKRQVWWYMPVIPVLGIWVGSFLAMCMDWWTPGSLRNTISWMSQPSSCEHGKVALLPICHVMAWDGERWPPQCPSSLRQVGELAPTLGLGNTAELTLRVLSELTLRKWKQENWPWPLLIAARGKFARTTQESSP